MNLGLGLGFGLREVFGEKTEDRQFLARAVGDRMWPMPKKKFGKTEFSHISEEVEEQEQEQETTVKENIYFAQGDREPLTLLFPPSLRNSIICNLYVGAVLFSAFDYDQARLLLEGKK